MTLKVHDGVAERQALKQLAASSREAGIFFEDLASRQYDVGETKVRVAVARTGLSRRDVLGFFKRLDELRVGTLVIGRKGHETRFRWDKGYRTTDVGKVALGELEKLQEEDNTGVQAEEPEDQFVAHTFRLRDGVFAEVKIPADITEREAERLSAFVKTLAI